MLLCRITFAILILSLALTANASAGVMLDGAAFEGIQLNQLEQPDESEEGPIHVNDLDIISSQFTQGSQPTSVVSAAVQVSDFYEVPFQSTVPSFWQLENSKLPSNPVLDGLLKPS